MKIVGLNKAGHDHVYFKYAFGLVFVGILLSIGTIIFGMNALVSDLFGTAVECVDVIIMILVNILSVVARIMPAFFIVTTFDVVFYGFYAVLSIVSGIMYLVFIKRASKALA